MIRRLCGYQVKIKVNAFRLRAGVLLAVRKLGNSSAAESDLQVGSGRQMLRNGSALAGRLINENNGGFSMETAESDMQASYSEQAVSDPGKGKKPITRFALEKAAEVKVLLHSDLGHHYSISKLARKVGTNAKTLQDGFKQLSGKTIFEYGQGLRLEEGKKLLRETDQSIQEISEACGYAEQANFTAAFKKRFGVAPGVWRKGSNNDIDAAL